MIRRLLAFSVGVFAALTVYGQTSVDGFIRELSADEPLVSGIVGVKAVTLSGRVIADYNSRSQMLPASNVKLISTGLALDRFGADYRFETTLGYSGEIDGGILDGDLYIIGSGDPTLGVGGKAVISSLFGQWKDILGRAGIKGIDGRIIADHRAMGCIPVNPAWLLEDVTSGEGLDSRGLNFAKNVKDYTHLFNPNFLTEASPLDTCARAFGNYLLSGGFDLNCRYADDSASGVVPAGDLTIIGKSRSDKLSKITAFTNYTSDNFYAEALMHLALQGTDLDKALSKIGVPSATGCNIVDGCGLSRKDYVSPSFLCDFLAAMATRDCFRDYLMSLPQPGKGTLIMRMRETPAPVRERIYMKSGSMNGVRCFSGYVMPSDGEDGDIIVFSVLTNNIIAHSHDVFESIDSIIAAIAGQN